MLRFKFFLLLFFASFLQFNNAFCQALITPQTLEKNILSINIKPLSAPTDAERIKASIEIQDQLLEGLLNPLSFTYPFDSLKYSKLMV